MSGKAIAAGEFGFFQTGIAALDSAIGGLPRGQLTVIAGATSMGKTTLMMNLFYRDALAGRRTAFFSLEMPYNELATHIVASHTQTPGNVMRLRMLSPSEIEHKYEASAQALHGCEAHIYDTKMNKDSIENAIRAHLDTDGLDTAYIDYLQLAVSPTKGQSMHHACSDLARWMSKLALELRISIITGSQLVKGHESRSDHRPKLSDLKESGDIANNARLVLLLYRPHYYGVKDADEHDLTVYIGKQSMGPRKAVNLRFDGPTFRIESPGDEDVVPF